MYTLDKDIAYANFEKEKADKLLSTVLYTPQHLQLKKGATDKYISTKIVNYEVAIFNKIIL